MSSPILTGKVLDQFLRRLLIDCLMEQSREYWLERASTFENARSRVGDFTGLATPEQIRDQDERLSEIAQACRNAATLCTYDDYREALEALYGDVLGEAA